MQKDWGSWKLPEGFSIVGFKWTEVLRIITGAITFKRCSKFHTRVSQLWEISKFQNNRPNSEEFGDLYSKWFTPLAASGYYVKKYIMKWLKRKQYIQRDCPQMLAMELYTLQYILKWQGGNRFSIKNPPKERLSQKIKKIKLEGWVLGRISVWSRNQRAKTRERISSSSSGGGEAETLHKKIYFFVDFKCILEICMHLLYV